MSVKEQLEIYSNDIKKLTNINAKQFDVAQIANMVTSIPERKWNAANGIVNGTIAYKDAKATLRTTKSLKMLEANKMKDKYGSADDRKAYAETHPDTVEAELTMLNAEAELLAAKLGYECLDDLFTAGKKIMDYLTDQERQTKQYERFNNEPRKG